MDESRELYRLLADLLEYPREDYAARARRCLGLLGDLHPGAARGMSEFVRFIESSPRALLEESFTSTFDLQPACCPYVGHHLLGDNHKRGMLLAQLKEVYRTRGFEYESDLPDHASAVLRFLATLDDRAEAQDLVQTALKPAFEKMADTLKDDTRGYGHLIRAASMVMSDE